MSQWKTNQYSKDGDQNSVDRSFLMLFNLPANRNENA